jgi:hypothetical protein
MKNELIKALKSKISFLTFKSQDYEIPKTFPKCFLNKALLDALKSVEFSFKNKRNINLSGKEGNGFT